MGSKRCPFLNCLILQRNELAYIRKQLYGSSIFNILYNTYLITNSTNILIHYKEYNNGKN